VGRASRARVLFHLRTGLVGALLAVSASTASADPLFAPPDFGKVRYGGGSDDDVELGFLADMQALGVIGSDRLSAWPDRRLGVLAPFPQLIAVRAGLRADFRDEDLTLVARIDLSEPWRPYVDTRALPLADAIVDDLYLLWKPARPIELLIGRARVPFSKARQLEEIDDPFGAPPFVVDRIAPDRRWGVTAYGDLGALAYAGGVYEDLDDLETRIRTGDPSAGGALAAAAHLEWTPRAPLYGSNPPGAVVGAQGLLPTPRSDPWFDTVRPSAGAGVLYRLRDDGSSRLDGTLSGQVKIAAFSALAEAIVSLQGGQTKLGGHAELMVTPVDKLALMLRGEIDQGAPNGGEWTTEAGVGWYVTKDRRNKVELLGWLRRDVDRGTPYDALVVLFQASL
jgi:hypothetical protein